MSTTTIDFSSPALAPTAGRRLPHRGETRLTRRGRLVVVLAALLLLLVCGVVIAARSVATEEMGTPEPTRVVMVGTGQTLWDISAGLAGDGDVRAEMSHITELNHLDSGMLIAGQRLRVPLG